MIKQKKSKKFEKLNFPNGFTLIGTDNDGYRHRYSVKKNENFKKIFIEFMAELGFDKSKITQEFWSSDELKGDFELKISDFEDYCRHYENKKYDVDIFYGNKKIIFVIRTKERRTILDNLEYKSKWINPIKVKKIKEKNNGKVVIPLQNRSSRIMYRK